MATTRLRKAFKYPTDDDLPPTSSGIDSQEQEELIAQLRDQDSSTTSFYRAVFLAVPALAALHIVYVLLSQSSAYSFGGAVLALSSLAASGWLLYGLPVVQGQKQQQGRFSGQKNSAQSPFEKYLAPMNGLLATVLALSGLVAARKSEHDDGGQGAILAVIPLVVYLIILVARSHLSLVDIDGLSQLKYDYKGA